MTPFGMIWYLPLSTQRLRTVYIVRRSTGQVFFRGAGLFAVSILFFFFSSFYTPADGKNKALAHHTSTYFHTRRVSI